MARSEPSRSGSVRQAILTALASGEQTGAELYGHVSAAVAGHLTHSDFAAMIAALQDEDLIDGFHRNDPSGGRTVYRLAAAGESQSGQER